MKILLNTIFVLALVVVILGAWTRLGDAGLSCPDWPTCYGQFTVPDKISSDYTRPLEQHKAWKEVIHRYAASALGVLAIIIFALVIKKIQYKNLRKLSILLLLIVVGQGALGAFTVTELVHPGIVSLHLLGGFITTGLIFTLLLKQKNPLKIKIHSKKFLYLMLILVFIQIFLGGWTSTHYAALSCGNFFPSCLGSYTHIMDFDKIFYWGELGVNYEYGILPESTKIAIQWLHRIGALILTVISILFIYKFSQHKVLTTRIIIFTVLFAIQLSLGAINVLASLPMESAVAHNIVALLLLLSLLNIILTTKTKEI